VEKPFDSSLKKVQPKEGETGAKVVENAQDNAQAVRVNQTYNENSSSLVVVPESPTVNLAELNPIDEGRLGPGRLNSRLKKKRGLGKIPLYLVLSISPILVALTVLATDPCAGLYFKAKTFDGFNNKAIADYSAALRIRYEPYIVKERANLERELGKSNAAGSDYLGLFRRQKLSPDGDAYEAMATEMIGKHGVTPEALTLLRQGALLAVRAKPNGIFGLKTTEGDVCKIDFDLILCGDKNDIKKVSTIAFDDDRVVEGEVHFLKADALRELDQNKQSTAILSKLDVENYVGYRAATLGHSLLALLKLDDDQGAAAERLVDNYKVKLAKARANEKIQNDKSNNNDILMDGYNEDWSLNLASAWAAFNQGKYKVAMKNSDAAATELNFNQGDIAKYHGAAANHLLRAHIFKAQKLQEKADEELTSYRNNHFSGKFFIPKIYRRWLSE
jgi:hypothetical protein